MECFTSFVDMRARPSNAPLEGLLDSLSSVLLRAAPAPMEDSKFQT